VVVYSDTPEAFAGLPVIVEPLDQATLDDWAGADGYQHRRKAMCIRDAVAKFGLPLAFIDGDTWFRKSPAQIFTMIKPGTAVLHLPEGRLLPSASEAKKSLSAYVGGHTFTTLSGGPFTIAKDAMVWNSGVVALHPDDAALLDDWLHLIDEIWAGHRASHDIEQFALGQVLERRLRIRRSDDIVFHYWPLYLREPFDLKVPSLIAAAGNHPGRDRLEELYRDRPRPRGLRLARVTARRAAQRVGLRTSSVNSSG
jgi:hypothetical protein